MGLIESKHALSKLRSLVKRAEINDGKAKRKNFRIVQDGRERGKRDEGLEIFYLEFINNQVPSSGRTEKLNLFA